MQQPWAATFYPVAAGMLLYTIIVSSGYFVQKRVWPIVGMFAVLLILTVIELDRILADRVKTSLRRNHA
jgi:hypothetical protein